MNIKRNIQLFNNKENSTGITKLNNDNINELKIYCIEIQKSKIGKKKFESITDELIKVIEFLKVYEQSIISY